MSYCTPLIFAPLSFSRWRLPQAEICRKTRGMMKQLHAILGAGTLLGALLCSPASSAVITHVALPGQVPDEQPPRVNAGDAPGGWGPDSWQGPASGKTNWHARYRADGDYLSVLFPAAAAGLHIRDLASISYYTKADVATPAGRDWWIQIYTRPDGVDDTSGWYGYKFTNNYNEHSHDGSWQSWSTDAGMTFSLGADELTLSALASDYGTE